MIYVTETVNLNPKKSWVLTELRSGERGWQQSDVFRTQRRRSLALKVSGAQG